MFSCSLLNGLRRRLAANARAAIIIDYPFRQRIFEARCPGVPQNMENSCGQSQFISWPALATFSDGIKRQCSWRLQRTSHLFVEDAERSECSRIGKG